MKQSIIGLHLLTVLPLMLSGGTLLGARNKARKVELSEDITASKNRTKAQINEIKTEQEFNQILQSDKPVIIDVYAKWCGACSMFKEPFSQVAHLYKDGAEFYRIDYDNPNMASLKARWNISGLPTTVYVAGGEIKDKKPGSFEYKVFQDQVKKFLTTHAHTKTSSIQKSPSTNNTISSPKSSTCNTRDL
jgi:thioredoxin 1